MSPFTSMDVTLLFIVLCKMIQTSIAAFQNPERSSAQGATAKTYSMNNLLCRKYDKPRKLPAALSRESAKAASMSTSRKMRAMRLVNQR